MYAVNNTAGIRNADVTPGVHQVSCDSTIDVVTVPEVCTRRSCGVIVDVHGGMMSSQMEDKNTNLEKAVAKVGPDKVTGEAMYDALLGNTSARWGRARAP